MGENLLALQHLPCVPSFLPLWRLTSTQDPPSQLRGRSQPTLLCQWLPDSPPLSQLPVVPVQEHFPWGVPVSLSSPKDPSSIPSTYAEHAPPPHSQIAPLWTHFARSKQEVISASTHFPQDEADMADRL